MTELERRLTAALGEGRVLAAFERPPRADEDICRYPLGAPAAWVRPRSTVEVQRVVRVARELGAPVVPVGRRTAYWRPLDFERAIVLDGAALDALGAPDRAGGFVRCGAGVTVRALDAALRAVGSSLAAYPDAYGDTSIGAMVATGFASGIGMARATMAEQVVGIEVVLGTGELLRTGTANVLGVQPFTRGGLPDPTEIFFASEGSLGVITEVAVRAWPRPALMRLDWELAADGSSLRSAVALAQRLRLPGLYATLRVEVTTPQERGRATVRGMLVVQSPLGRSELVARAAFAAVSVRDAFRGARITHAMELGPDDPPVDRFWGEPGEHERDLRDGRFAGVDVLLPYGAALDGVEVGAALLDDARGRGPCRLRCALYFSPDVVNLGLHVMFDESVAPSLPHAWAQQGARRLADLPSVPYRWGRVFGPAMGARLDPSYRVWLRSMKQTFDPDGIMNPGVGPLGGDP